MGNGTFTEVRNMDREKVWGDEIISSVLRYMGGIQMGVPGR